MAAGGDLNPPGGQRLATDFIKPGDLLLALLANTAWAFNFIVGKAGVTQFQPFLFTALRFAILLLALLPFLRWIPGRMRSVLGTALVLGVLHFSLIFAGLKASGDISSVAIASQLYIPFSALLAVVWLGETLDRRRLVGITLACGGVLVIGFDPVVFQHLDALRLIAAGAMAMAVATIQMRQLRGVSVFVLQAWIALCATPALALLSLLFETGQLTALLTANGLELAAPLYSAIGASLVGHGIVYYLLGRYPVSVTTPLMLLTPPLAVAFGVWLWGDVLTWKLLLGGGMTLAGIAAITIVTPYRRTASAG
ncbi:MAG: EamA family transporter [Candidatus Competibacteraceae bacterium]